jgi:hypothetical protein
MPKVSFYVRNEDYEAWKAIKKKTEWIHGRLEDQRWHDMSPPAHSMVIGRREYDVFPTDNVEIIDVKDYNLCKHGAVLGMCKKGCK